MTIPDIGPVVREALADAIAYRLPDACSDCASGTPCADHQADAERVKRYAETLALLGAGEAA